MSDIIKIGTSEQRTIDSRIVADMVDKRHDNLVRDIETYIFHISEEQTSNLRADQFFVESSYEAGTGKAYKCYLVTKKGCELIANKLTGAKGIKFTAAYVNKFNEMESSKGYSLPGTYLEALEALVATERGRVALQAQNSELSEQNQIMAPKAGKYDRFMSGGDGMEFGDAAKLLGTGRNRLFDFCRTHGLLMDDNEPYQKHVDSGRFKVVVVSWDYPYGVPHHRNKTLVTPKGLDYLSKIMGVVLCHD